MKCKFQLVFIMLLCHNIGGGDGWTREDRSVMESGGNMLMIEAGKARLFVEAGEK